VLDWFEFAMSAFHSGDLEQAHKLLFDLSKSLPEDVAIWHNLGLV